MKRLSISKKYSVSSRGFTLLELLIVVALIMVLAGLLIPAFFKIRDRVKAEKRKIEISIISLAIKTYKVQERKFPAPPDHLSDLSGRTDRTYGADEGVPRDDGNNREVMSLLTNAVPPVLDPHKLRWDDNGNVLDPDGNQYNIRLDLDYDGKIDDSYTECKVW